jgi:hypothetical protein
MVTVLAVGKCINGKPIITKKNKEAYKMDIYKSRDRPVVGRLSQRYFNKGGST